MLLLLLLVLWTSLIFLWLLPPPLVTFPLVWLQSLMSKGEHDPDLLLFPLEDGAVPEAEAISGSTKQAAGVSRSMLWKASRWLRTAAMSSPTNLHILQSLLFNEALGTLEAAVLALTLMWPTCSAWKCAFMAMWRWKRFLQTGHWKQSCDLSFSFLAAAVSR